MLVLERNIYECIYICAAGEKIEVKLVEIKGRKVKLGITASKSVEILRDDVKKRVK